MNGNPPRTLRRLSPSLRKSGDIGLVAAQVRRRSVPALMERTYFADRPVPAPVEDAMTKQPHLCNCSPRMRFGDSYSCIVCVWRSGAANISVRWAGKGQVCKSMRRLLLLIDGWALPA